MLEFRSASACPTLGNTSLCLHHDVVFIPDLKTTPEGKTGRLWVK